MVGNIEIVGIKSTGWWGMLDWSAEEHTQNTE